MTQPNREAALAEAKQKYELEVEKAKRLHPNDEIMTFEEWLEENKV